MFYFQLEPLDAGAENGLTFTSPHWETIPPEPVTKHGPRQPNHPAAGFYYPNLQELPSIAKIKISKVRLIAIKYKSSYFIIIIVLNIISIYSQI